MSDRDDFDDFIAELHRKYPKEWKRGFDAGLVGGPHDKREILNAAYQAGWLYGNIARNEGLFLSPEDRVLTRR